MAQETLRIIVDAGQLDQIISKVRVANSQTLNIGKAVNDMRRSAREAGINLDDLPTLNRDARLLANSLNIPGFREASAILFQARRGVRAGQLAREAQAIAGLDPELSKQLSTQALLGSAAMVAFVVKIVVDTIQRFIKEEEARSAEFEDMIREGLELNHQEFEALSREQTGFSSWVDQFEAGAEDKGFFATIKIMVEEILASFIGVYPDIYPEYVNIYAEPLE